MKENEYGNEKNIVLIGMPGAGKSTAGVILAKALGFSFCDTDLVIQMREAQTLQQIINNKGISCFLQIEKEIIRSLDLTHHVIATGGSVIYYRESMDHLRKGGYIIYLDVDYHVLKKRITNMTTRGIAMDMKKTFRDVYSERVPLYKKYAQVTIECGKKHVEQIVEQIIFRVTTIS